MTTLWNTFLAGDRTFNVDTGEFENTNSPLADDVDTVVATRRHPSSPTRIADTVVRQKLGDHCKPAYENRAGTSTVSHPHNVSRFGERAPPSTTLTIPNGSAKSRGYIGWAGRGYKTTSDDSVKNQHRAGVLSQHTLTFTLEAQSETILEFKIIDQIDETIKISDRSIRSRRLTIESAPPGFALTSVKPTQESDYPSHHVVFPANLSHITEMTFRAETGPHAGMTITLLVALVERTGPSRSYTHKDVVGVIIHPGDNEKVGHSWDAEFNFLKPAVLGSDPSHHRTTLKEGNRTLQLQWVYGKLPRFTDGTGDGYQIFNDPLERPNFALMRRPSGDFIPLERRKDGTLRLRDNYKEVKKDEAAWATGYRFGPKTVIVSGEPPVILHELPGGKILQLETDAPTFYDFSIHEKEPGWHGGFMAWGGGGVRAKPEAFRTTTADLIWNQDEGLATLSWTDTKHGFFITLTDVIVAISAITGKPQFDFEHARYVVRNQTGQIQEVAFRYEGSHYIATAGQTLHIVKNVDSLEDAWLVEMDSIDFADTNMIDETQGSENWTSLSVGDPAELSITERVIAGHPFRHYALPLFIAPNDEHKAGINHAGRIREALEEAKVGKPNLYTFTGPWQIRLEMAVEEGQLRPVIQPRKGLDAVEIREITYHDGAKNHEAKKSGGKYIATDTNSFGWAIETTFQGRVIFIQPYTADLDPKRLEAQAAKSLEETTDVFGLMITSDLVPATLAATRAFQGVMPHRGAYGEINRPAAADAAAEKQLEMATTDTPPVETTPVIPPLFPTPGLETQTDPQLARETFIKVHLSSGSNFSLQLSVGDISFKVKIYTQSFFGNLLLRPDEITLYTSHGEQKATLKIINADSGYYQLVDSAGNRYFLLLTHNDVHLSTTPLKPGMNIDPTLAQKWISQTKQKNRATSDFLGLRGQRLQLSHHVPGSYPVKAEFDASSPEDVIVHYKDGSKMRIELATIAGKQVPRRLSYKGAHDQNFTSGSSSTVLYTPAKKVGQGISLIMNGIHVREPSGRMQIALFYNVIFATRDGIVIPVGPESPYRGPGITVRANKLHEQFEVLKRKGKIWLEDTDHSSPVNDNLEAEEADEGNDDGSAQ